MALPSDSKSVSSVDDFLQKLLSKRARYAPRFSKDAAVPHWAETCTHLLYSSKSIPLLFLEANKLYLCYEGSGSSVSLMGETTDKKRINRSLSVETKGSTIIVRSKHRKLEEKSHPLDKDKHDPFIVFEGKGSNFQDALSNYFTHSDLKSASYQFTVSDIQGEGDAFLLQQTMLGEGQEQLLKQIIEALKTLFSHIPEEQHALVYENIGHKLKLCPVLKKLAAQYDARLWAILDSMMKHFDSDELDDNRRAHRDHLIADCCTRSIKGADIVSCLDEYFSVLKMHNEILNASLSEEKNALLKDYKKQHLYPEVAGHREQIKNYFKRYLALK